ncbi:MAG: hypothetical protein IPM57_09470 [Oligoflexia bacterium]|nr:hypothetical protein [Oligoflexia bacterium]
MKVLIFILAVLFSFSPFAQANKENQAIDLLRSFIPPGKRELNLKGVVQQQPNLACQFTLNYNEVGATPVTAPYREVSASLSAQNYTLFSKFDLHTANQTSNRVLTIESNAQKSRIVRLKRQNNQYAPVERATIDILKSPTGKILGVYILVEFARLSGYSKHTELTCRF